MATASLPSLKSFRLLSFDVFGTIIDWETGILAALHSLPPFSLLPSTHPLLSDRKALLAAYEPHERAVQNEHPSMLYRDVLAESFRRLVRSCELSTDDNIDDAAAQFAASISRWPAFPDSVAAMQALARRYKLVALSNVDDASLARCMAGTLHGVPFAATYTAEQVGAYKPDRRNFEFLLRAVGEEFGVEKGEVLHVAQSLFHDHRVCGEMGVWSCWVDRKGVMGDEGGDGDAKGWSWRVGSLGELVELVERD